MEKYVSFGAVFRNCWAITSNSICSVLVVYYTNYQFLWGLNSSSILPKVGWLFPKYHDHIEVICKSSVIQTPNRPSILVGCENHSEMESFQFKYQ